MNKSEAFDILRSRNIVRVVVDFSGGNDEGGADAITGYTADNTEVDVGVNHAAYQGEYVDGEYQPDKWIVRIQDGNTWGHRDATPEEIAVADLIETLEKPVYDTYGGFAGDFYVSGTLTWDVVAETVKMDRSESVMQEIETEDIDF